MIMAETGNLPGVEQAMMPEESDVFSSRFDYCQAENTLNIEYAQAVSGIILDTACSAFCPIWVLFGNFTIG